MNNRGTDKLLSVYWFVILIIVAGGISAMVYNFYSYPYDVRDVESKVLSDKLANCISQGGILNANLFDDKEGNFKAKLDENILSMCNLNFAPEGSFNNEEQFYFEINFYEVVNKNNVLNITHGNPAWKADCEISKSKDYKNLVKCSDETFYSLDNSKKLYSIKILTITKKTEKNVQ